MKEGRDYKDIHIYSTLFVFQELYTALGFIHQRKQQNYFLSVLVQIKFYTVLHFSNWALKSIINHRILLRSRKRKHRLELDKH